MRHSSRTTSSGRRNKFGLRKGSSLMLAVFAELVHSCPDLILKDKALKALKEKDFLSLVSLEKSTSFLDIDSYRRTYLVESYLKKVRFDIPGIDRKAAAMEKWRKAETVCGNMNKTFRDRWNGNPAALFDHDVEEVLYLARRKIKSMFKRPFDPYKFLDRCYFGPGADLSTRGGRTSAFHKYGSRGHISEPARQILSSYMLMAGDVRLEDVRNASSSDYGLLLFVPKKATIDRTINKGPRWNVFAQLGLGSLMADLLRQSGIDISDQTRNQRLAQTAYSRGLCTVDLSMASDSIYTNLVIDLFADVEDPCWLDLILGLREPFVKLPDEERKIRLEKISAMGNGYTFPLETAIFYALAHSCYRYLGVPIRDSQGSTLGTYGDDIIVRSECFDLLRRVFTALGFTLNRDKTFSHGPFYESCGTDYYKGRNVRPVFCKEDPVTVQQAYSLHNQIFSLGSTAAHADGFVRREYYDICRKIREWIPKDLVFLGPTVLGDACLHSTFDEWSQFAEVSCPSGLLTAKLKGLTQKEASRLALRDEDYKPLLLSKLHGGTVNKNRVQLRRGSVTQKVSKFTIHWWLDFTVID